MFLFLLACDGGEPATPTPPPEPAPAVAPAPEPEPEPDPPAPMECTDGRVVYPFWPGEYPAPILQINAPVTLKVTNSICNPPSFDCEVPPGLYHPWSKDMPLNSEFMSRTAPTVYTARAGASIDGQPLEVGTDVIVRTYLSEGMCAMEIGGSPLEASCPGTQGDHWTEKPRTAPPDDQILQVDCAGGGFGWLVVDSGLKDHHAEIVEGELVGYGEVKRAE